MNKIYDLIIIGSGPAGLSAAVYAQRACLDTLIIEKAGISGGQILTTAEIDNYPGLPGIGGFELGMKMHEHVQNLGGQFLSGEVSAISRTKDSTNDAVLLTCIHMADGSTLLTRTVIIAAGANHRKLGIPGEESLIGAGVSYCATCDGAFFRNKVTAVLGGGDVAVEDAAFLAKLCQKVYVIHRRDNFRAAKVLSDRLLRLENVEVLWDTLPVSIDGNDHVQSLTVKNKNTNETTVLNVDGVFVAVGMEPNTDIYKGLVDLDETGYIIADESCQTSAPGIFAAGDIRTKPLRQVVCAVSDGASAVYSVQRYLRESGMHG